MDTPKYRKELGTSGYQDEQCASVKDLRGQSMAKLGKTYTAEDIRAIKAAAWFEGWDAGDTDAAKQQNSLASSGKALPDDEMSDNPYA